MSKTVWVATYECRNGENKGVFTTKAAALAWRSEIGAMYWDASFPHLDPDPDADIGEAYFDEMALRCRDEYFTLEEVDLQD